MLTRIVRGAAVIAALALVGACATGRAVSNAQAAVKRGDWDAAVAYYREALNDDPSRIDIKISLERSMQFASAEHLKRAKALEAEDQLSGAAAEYRLAADLDPGNSLALGKAIEIERKIRDQVEATRPRPRIDDLRQQAAQAAGIPKLDPRVRVTFSAQNASVRDILNTIGQSTGINIQYDQNIPTLNNPYSINLQDVSLEDALNQIMVANTLTYKVNGPKSIFVYADNQANRQKYEDQYVQTFYLSNSDPQEMVQIINQVLSQGPAVRPVVFPNKTANTVEVKATAPVMQIIAGIIDANDKPRAEVMVDVEILEVDRTRAKNLGLDLSNYALGFQFSPEVAPPNTSGTFPPAVPPPFNLNTLSRGISPTDFYMTVPSAQIQLLESDSKTKVLARPQLRGREGVQLQLRLGEDVPIPQTVFQSAAAGGIQNIPTTQVVYRSVGVNLTFTPRVTYQDEIVLDQLQVEKSGLGDNINVGGQTFPTITSRTATTTMRLRDGESNMLAGLLAEEDTSTLTSFPGIMQIPVLRSLFGNTNTNNQSTDIVMVVTPHIVRSHDLTTQDFKPMYVGTGQNFGAGATPGLISPDAPPPPQPAQAGAQPAGQAPARGAGPGQPTTPPTGAPQPTPTPPPAARPTEAPKPNIVPVEPVTAAPTPPQAPPAQVVVTAPQQQTLAVGGVPATVPIVATGVSGLSTITLTVNYDPAVIRAVSVAQGTFMQQAGSPPNFTQKIDAAAGRIDIAIVRTGDQAGVSGTGLLAGIVFQPVAAGTSQITVTVVAMNAQGQPIPMQPVPSSLTVK